MKTPLPLLSLGLFAATHACLAAGPTIPQRPPPDAFQKLTEDWPFALATPAAPVAEVVAPWSSNYFVSGIGKNYEKGVEEVFVGIKKKDGTGGFSLYGNQVNKDEDVSVAGIEWSDLLKSQVILKKGAEFATIEFDQAAAHAQAAGMPATPRPGMPPLPGARQQPMIRPPGVPANVVPRPANLPQTMPQAVPLPGPSNTNAAPMPGNITPPNGPKQRVRVIKSTP